MCKQGYPNPNYTEKDVDTNTNTVELLQETIEQTVEVELDIERYNELIMCETIVKAMKQHMKQKYGNLASLNHELIGALLAIYRNDDDD